MIHTYGLQRVDKSEMEENSRYMVKWLFPEDKEDHEFDIKSLQLIDGVSMHDGVLAKRMNVFRKTKTVFATNISSADAQLITDIITENGWELEGQENYFFNLEPVLQRDDARKLKMIKALHAAAKSEDEMGDFFFENVSRILEDKYVYEDDQRWKLNCRTEFAKWLVNKKVVVTHHSSTLNEDVTLDVKVIGQDNDRLIVYVDKVPDGINDHEIGEFERVPVSLEALDNIEELTQSYETSVQHPLVYGLPACDAEEELINRFE